MKKIVKSIVILIIVTLSISTTTLAANYSSNYQEWSQGASDYDEMSTGCWIVAQAKLIYESGIDRSKNFNPDTYYLWEKANGFISSNGRKQVNGWQAPIAYAKTKGYDLVCYENRVNFDKSKVFNNTQKGFYTILGRDTNAHYVLVANELTKENNEIWYYESSSSSASKKPKALKNEKYEFVFTYYLSGKLNEIVNGCTVVNYPLDGNTIYDNEAKIHGRINKKKGSIVSKMGCKVWKDGTSEKSAWTKFENANESYSNTTTVKVWYTLKESSNIKLEPGTKYWYKIYAVVDGVEGWSNATPFITTGGASSNETTIQTVPSANTKNFTISNFPSKNTIEQTNAIIYGRVDKNVNSTVSKIGVKVWKDGTSESSAWTKFEKANQSYANNTYMYAFYNLNKELNITLEPGTKYWYKIYAVVDGVECWSEATSFTTLGHTHSWTSDYEAAHPHKVFNRCRTCGETEYTGGTKKLDNCELCHEHTYGSEMYTSEHPHTMYKICTSCGEVLYPWPYKTQKNDDCEECYPHEHNWTSDYEAAHPHKEYRYCSCGEKEYTGNTNNVKNCEQCNPITRVTVFYNSNGGTEAPSPKTVNSGEKITVSKEKLSRSGYEFLGWAENSKAQNAVYTGGEKIKLTNDVTLYAVWRKKDNSTSKIILTIGSTKATVFGQTAYNDVAPILENSRTMLPARFVAENLGAEVSWNDDTQTVIIEKDDIYIQIIIGSSYAYVNGEPVYLDSPAFLRNSRTYTPVRFICENLGAKVDWDDAKQQVIITK